jgi:multidrug transporter EmrE-like cation transporter
MRADFCSGCNKPILTANPLNLCPDCDLTLKTRWAKETTWEDAPVWKRAVVRLFFGVTIIAAFVCLSLAMWILEPSYARAFDHPWSFFGLIAAAIIGYLSYQKARNIKRRIEKSPLP